MDKDVAETASVILFANTDWYLYNFRLPLARALIDGGYDVLLVSPPGKYSQRMIASGFQWLAFPFSQKGVNPFRELLTLFRLIRLYEQRNPKFVHHFTIKCVLYGSIAARLTGVKKIINSITGLGYVFVNHSMRAKTIRALVKSIYRYALAKTTVIFQNSDDHALFARMGVLKSVQTAIIRGSGADTSIFLPANEEEGTPVVVLPARLLYSKGVAEFVQAARELKEKGVAARYVLVGDLYAGNPDSVDNETLQKWIEDGHIEWWGWQEDMPAVFARCHVVCLPSYREGMPKTLAEAAASGKPIVATDVPGCREIVTHGRNGFLVPVKDPHALADALEKLICDKELREQMGKNGRDMVVQGFSLEVILRETLKFYRP